MSIQQRGRFIFGLQFYLLGLFGAMCLWAVTR